MAGTYIQGGRQWGRQEDYGSAKTREKRRGRCVRGDNAGGNAWMGPASHEAVWATDERGERPQDDREKNKGREGGREEGRTAQAAAAEGRSVALAGRGLRRAPAAAPLRVPRRSHAAAACASGRAAAALLRVRAGAWRHVSITARAANRRSLEPGPHGYGNAGAPPSAGWRACAGP